MSVVALVCAAVAGLGAVEVLVGFLLVRRFVAAPRPIPRALPPVSILKPLKGSEPLLEEALTSFLEQDYPEFQVIFGAAKADDPALSVARRVAARFPGRDVTFVVGRTAEAANPKVANLLAMWPAARHDLIVIADQDVHAPSGTLAALAAALEDPRVGLVSTLYTGVAACSGPVGALGVSRITHDFLPATLLGRAFGRADTLGATMALRRAVLERAGGFATLRSELADDAVLGRRVQALGLEARLAATVVGTTVVERDFAALFRHELRWARTIRSLAPLGFAGSALGYPLAFGLLAVVCAAAASWSLAFFAALWFGRIFVARAAERALGLGRDATPGWVFPLRDILSLTELLVSYAGNRVEWRGTVLSTGRPGHGTSLTVPQKGFPSR